MTELSGFSPIAKLAPDVAPQSLRIPITRTDAVGAAAEILGALWDAVDAGLSPNVKIEVLRYNPPGGSPTTMCRITPVAPDGVANTTANPGDWLTADSNGLRGMTNDAYAAQFTQNVPLEWAATTTAPTATLNEDGTVTLGFPQPTSANRPFTYTATGPGTIGQFVTDPSGNVAATITGLTGDTLGPWTVECDTQYEGVRAMSLPSNTVSVPQGS